MRVLICHNFYQQAGGEDQVFASEIKLLRENGHDVATHEVHNDAVDSMGKIKAAGATIWNRQSAARVARLTRGHRAQVVHFHNTFPLISPAAYSAARAQGAAVVQTLHNYRLLCPAATFFRDGRPCEECLGRLPLPSVAHGCYRGRAVAAVCTAMLGVHRALGTYQTQIDSYIALSQFARDKFIAAGFPSHRIHLKPNFIDPDPGIGPGDGGFALFVGRLTEEKGVRPLLDAWQQIRGTLPLKILGDGPLAPIVENACKQQSSIQWLGRRPLSEVIDLMGRATLLVFPSLWYEGFPRTIVEAYARGTPVIASDLGSMKELIAPDRTGLLFRPGDPRDMARQILHLASDGPLLARLRPLAREEFLNRYTAAQNLQTLLEIYRMAKVRRESKTTISLIAVS